MVSYNVASLDDITQIDTAIKYFNLNIQRTAIVLSDPEFREYRDDLVTEIMADHLGILALKYYIKQKKKNQVWKKNLARDTEKKALRRTRKGNDESHPIIDYKCPICRRPVWRNQKYCYHCGQRIGWNYNDESAKPAT